MGWQIGPGKRARSAEQTARLVRVRREEERLRDRNQDGAIVLGWAMDRDKTLKEIIMFGKAGFLFLG